MAMKVAKGILLEVFVDHELHTGKVVCNIRVDIVDA
jgi:hypothetical protein